MFDYFPPCPTVDKWRIRSEVSDYSELVFPDDLSEELLDRKGVIKCSVSMYV